MEAGRSGKSGVVGALTAVALIGAIGWLGADVVARMRVEGRLWRAATLIGENPVRGLESLEQETSAEGVSPRQRQQGAALARDAIERICSGRPMLRMIGRQPYDCARPHPYVTPNREMMLVFELPLGIKDLGRIRVSDGPHELCEVLSLDGGRQARGEVPLPADGAVNVDVDLVCRVGVYDPVTFPIAHGLRLVQRTRGPLVTLRAGATALDLKDRAPQTLQVDRGTPLCVELSDELGLSQMRWSLGGIACDSVVWLQDPDVHTRSAPLPGELTAEAAHGRTIEFEASNSIGSTTTAVVRLFVRDPVASPIARAWIQKTAVKDGSTVHSGERVMMLRVAMAPGEIPDDLVVTWEGQRLKGRVDGTEVVAILEAEVEGTKALVLGIRDAAVLQCAVHLDWTSPTVSVVLDPGRRERELEYYRASHDVPIGAIVSISATDLAGIDRDATEWTVDHETLDETAEPEPTPAPGSEAARAWTRTFRCARPGEARLSVAATDLAGNQSTIHEYVLHVVDPMAGRTITLNGDPFPAGAEIYANQTRFDVRTEGGIDLDGLVFSLLDPEQMFAPIGRVPLERGALAGTRIGVLDTSILAPSARRLTGVLSQNDRELSTGTIIMDFVVPSFRVKDAGDAGVIDGVARFYGAAGEPISLTITDDVGVDMGSISALQGADIAHTAREGSGASVTLTLPAVIEDPVVVEVTDVAGNRAQFRFEVVTNDDPDSRPDSQPDSRVGDPAAPPADEPPPLVHPLLETFFLVPARGSGTAFYISERELTLKEWLALIPKVK